MFAIHFESDDLSLEQIAARSRLKRLDDFEEVASVIEAKDSVHIAVTKEELSDLYTRVVGCSPSERDEIRRQLNQVLLNSSPTVK